MRGAMAHDSPTPSPWVAAAAAELARLPERIAKSRVLDLACGAGRHTEMLLAAGHRVLAVDRDTSGLRRLAGLKRIEILQFDLESGQPWPFAAERFKGVVVANYLHRPTLERTIGLVAPGGMLIYETFGVGNERLGRPSNPDFLARPGEIAALARRLGFSIAEDLHVRVDTPRSAVIHRVIARRLSA